MGEEQAACLIWISPEVRLAKPTQKRCPRCVAALAKVEKDKAQKRAAKQTKLGGVR